MGAAVTSLDSVVAVGVEGVADEDGPDEVLFPLDDGLVLLFTRSLVIFGVLLLLLRWL
jgi:hypothetical protein